jgi:RNA-directed DNA polymerase
VRYGDDFMVGFQHKDEAEHFLKDLRERCRPCTLERHPDKTRLIECGRLAAARRQRRGPGKPETFALLGLTPMGGQTQRGVLTVRRKTIATRLRRTLQEVKRPLRRRMHWPLQELGAWLRRVVTGHYHDYGVPRNLVRRRIVRDRLIHSWCHTLRRRSQRPRVTWQRMYH